MEAARRDFDRHCIDNLVRCAVAASMQNAIVFGFEAKLATRTGTRMRLAELGGETINANPRSSGLAAAARVSILWVSDDDVGTGDIVNG